MFTNGFYPVSLFLLFAIVIRHAPSPWVSLALLGVLLLNVTIHEMGHAAAVRLFGGRVNRVLITPWHGMINFDLTSSFGFVVVALGGPVAGIAAGSLALSALGAWSGAWAASATGQLLQAMLWAGIADNTLNLLPVWELDGNKFDEWLREWRIERNRFRFRPRLRRPFEEPGFETPFAFTPPRFTRCRHDRAPRPRTRLARTAVAIPTGARTAEPLPDRVHRAARGISAEAPAPRRRKQSFAKLAAEILWED